MSPKEALDLAMSRMVLERYSHRLGSGFGPGKLVESLPKEAREALVSLKDSDINNLRWDDSDVWSCSYNFPPKRFSSRYYK